MDSLQLWQRYCDWLYYHPELEIFVDISRIRFTPAQVEALRPLFARAFAEMQALEAGAIANPDEGRQVGHYWLRAPELAPTAEIRQAIQDCVEQVESFAKKIHGGVIPASGGGRFTELLWIGIGGSALGPQFVAEALAPLQPPLNIHFIDNTDPDGFDRVLGRLAGKLGQTLVIVASKSGNTPEPRNALVEVELAYRKAGIPFSAHAVAITGPGSQLEQQARQEGWLAVFPIFDWVGGAHVRNFGSRPVAGSVAGDRHPGFAGRSCHHGQSHPRTPSGAQSCRPLGHGLVHRRRGARAQGYGGFTLQRPPGAV